MAKPKIKKMPEKKVQKMGKNKKRAWKQIQHPDVEDYLDEMREDERLGGIRTKSNDELFALDKKGEDATTTWTRRSIPVLKSSSGPLVKIDDLKCFQLLKPHTQVPDPLIKRNRVKLPGEGKSSAMVLKDIRRQSRKKKEEQPVKPKILDPWAYKEPEGTLDSEWIPDSVKRHNLRPRITPPAKKYTPSELPAIAVPHPGFSYNPTFDDHQDLLKIAVTKEVKIQRLEKNLINATAILKCDTAEVKEEETSSEEEDEPEDKKFKRNDPKARTRQGKRKEREEKDKVRNQKLKKEESARMNEVFRIKSIQKEIRAADENQKARLAKLVQKNIEREKYGQKKLSRFKFVEPALNPALSEDLQGNLVAVPSDNCLLLDRFKSLQKRNIIEPRLRNTNKRKNKLKKFLRRSDKMEWEKTGMWNGIKIN